MSHIPSVSVQFRFIINLSSKTCMYISKHMTVNMYVSLSLAYVRLYTYYTCIHTTHTALQNKRERDISEQAVWKRQSTVRYLHQHILYIYCIPGFCCGQITCKNIIIKHLILRSDKFMILNSSHEFVVSHTRWKAMKFSLK